MWASLSEVKIAMGGPKYILTAAISEWQTKSSCSSAEQSQSDRHDICSTVLHLPDRFGFRVSPQQIACTDTNGDFSFGRFFSLLFET